MLTPPSTLHADFAAADYAMPAVMRRCRLRWANSRALRAALRL